MVDLVFDVETSMKPLCDPYNPKAKLCYIGLLQDSKHYVDYPIEYTDAPYGQSLNLVQEIVACSDTLVGANIKFDLNWCMRYGIQFTGKLIWDVLLVQYILNHQLTPYISLNEAAAQWGLDPKLDVVKLEYWDRGIDTPEVPEQILRDYLKQDVSLTYQIYELQKAEVEKRGILSLVRLHNQDLLMLVEMEHNGNRYDSTGSLGAAQKAQEDIDKLLAELHKYTPIAPRCWSTDFISLLLYGGIYKYVEKEAYTFTYKDGSTTEKMHNVEKAVELPRLVEPPKQKREKEGFWPTDEATLKNLKATGIAKKIVEALLKLRTIEKLVGTYLEGFPKRIEEAGWERELIHTSYSQTTAVTGRLTSSKPNVQNVPPEQKPHFTTRYGE